MKVNGIPSKPQAAALAALVVYVVAFVVFLCVNAEIIDDLSTRRIYALAGLIPVAAMYALVLYTVRNFPNVKEKAAKIVEEYPLLKEFGYKYDSFSYDKKRKILEVRYGNTDFMPFVFVLDVKENSLTPCLSNGAEFFRVWELLEVLDEDIYQSVDELNECMELLVGYMKDNPYSFAEDFKDCKNLYFHKVAQMESRPAAYHLNCYDGSVIIDINRVGGQLYLKRISFDGFGCFRLGNPYERLTAEESEQFVREMETPNPSQKALRPLVRKLIRLNRGDVEAAVFERYPLLKTWSNVGDKETQNPRKTPNAPRCHAKRRNDKGQRRHDFMKKGGYVRNFG